MLAGALMLIPGIILFAWFILNAEKENPGLILFMLQFFGVFGILGLFIAGIATIEKASKESNNTTTTEVERR